MFLMINGKSISYISLYFLYFIISYTCGKRKGKKEASNFSTPYLNVFKVSYLMFCFTEVGNLFQNEGPIYERLFCLMLVFQKGTLSLA